MQSRHILKTGLVVMVVGLVTGSFYILFGSLKPTEATVQNHTLMVDLTQIPPGTARAIESSRGPIYVVHRTTEDLANLDSLAKQVRDPNSLASPQPLYAQNPYRSIKPEWFICFGFAEHRGLPVLYTEQLPPGYEGRVTWFGGFYDRYDGALFDKAGRVFFVGHPYETNLPIPEHKYVAENTIAIYPFGL